MPKRNARDQPEWMNEEIIENIKQRRKYNKKKRHAQDEVEKNYWWMQYLEQKQKVQRMVLQAKSEYENRVAGGGSRLTNQVRGGEKDGMEWPLYDPGGAVVEEQVQSLGKMSMSGAEYLASIYGTEKDKVNCSFYIKTGACRHSERCSRKHNKPQYSQTIVMGNMYVSQQNSAKSADGSHLGDMSDHKIQEQFEYFFEDVFFECEEKYGEIEEMCVCDNQCDHLRGNVYIKFRKEEDAVKAAEDLNNRWYMFRPIYVDLCPVADFREASCRQFEMGQCGKGGFCNFWHVKPISHHLKTLLARSSRSRYKGRSKSRSRSRERRRRTRSRSRDRDRRERKGRY